MIMKGSTHTRFVYVGLFSSKRYLFFISADTKTINRKVG